MGVGQRRGGTASKKQLFLGWMWKDKAGGSAVLQENRDNQAERSSGKSGKGVGDDFLGANLMGFLPEGRVAKVHPAKTSCLTCVQVCKGPLSLA